MLIKGTHFILLVILDLKDKFETGWLSENWLCDSIDFLLDRKYNTIQYKTLKKNTIY